VFDYVFYLACKKNQTNKKKQTNKNRKRRGIRGDGRPTTNTDPRNIKTGINHSYIGKRGHLHIVDIQISCNIIK